MLTAKVHVDGAIFEGNPKETIDAYLDAAVNKVAAMGEADVQIRLRQVLQHPTGNYQAHIQTRHLFDAAVVYDGRVVYGPWLEGTDKRNKTTRFRGYATFRRVRDLLAAKAQVIADQLMDQYIRRLR